MKIHALFRTRAFLLSSLAVGVTAGAVAVRETVGSDHQQTTITELNPYLDATDVYAFPGSSDDRIAIATVFSSPIAGNRTLVGNLPARFDPNALYQIHVDNNQDGMDDVVFQFSFDELANGTQTVDVIGPVAPRRVQAPGAGVSHGFATTATPAVRRGAMNTTLTAQLAASGPAAAGQLQVFAGMRDDPFFIDLEQFFRIIPDRRPSTTPLSQIGGVVPAPPATIASTWRPRCTTGTTPDAGMGAFNAQFGCARDFLAGINGMAIVIELPESQLTQGRGDGQIGIWTTVSH